MNYLPLTFCALVLFSCKPHAEEIQHSQKKSIFYKLERCDSQLCVKSLIEDPKHLDIEGEFKTFLLIKIHQCKFADIPQISTAKCKEIKTYNSKQAQSEQFALVNLEQEYLKEQNLQILDGAIESMDEFVNMASACKANGFLNSYYGSSGSDSIAQYEKKFSSILNESLPFYNNFLNPKSSASKESGKGFNLVESAEAASAQRTDRIDPNAEYTLEVRKFNPVYSANLDITKIDYNGLTLEKLSDIQSSIQALVNLSKTNSSLPNRLKQTSTSGIVAAKDFWQIYPSDIVGKHVGVSFDPKGIIGGINQMFGQFERVIHPKLDPIKYVWQIFHELILNPHPKIAAAGAAKVSLNEIRQFANAGLGIYTSLAFVVRKGGADGEIIDSFVYPYTRQDHGLISLSELETLYKGNFTSTIGSKTFKGSEYKDFLEKNKDRFLDEMAQVRRIRESYNHELENFIDKLTPFKVESSTNFEKLSDKEKKKLEENIKAQNSFREEIKDQIRKNIHTYINLVDFYKEMDILEAKSYKDTVEIELKRDVLRIAISVFNFNSPVFRRIAAEHLSVERLDDGIRGLEDFTGAEVEEVFQDFKKDPLISDKDYAKYVKSDMYKYRKRFRSFDFVDFADEITAEDKLDKSVVMKEFLKDLGISKSAKSRVEQFTSDLVIPLLEEYKQVQDLGWEEKLNFKQNLKLQIKYDFIRIAVTEYGYESEKLKEISKQAEFSLSDIFDPKKKYHFKPEDIDEIYAGFLNEHRLERFETPKKYREFVKNNRSGMSLDNPLLHRYQDHIRGIDFEGIFQEIEHLNRTKGATDLASKELINKISPETCKTSCKLLELAGYEEQLETINKDKIFSHLQEKNGKVVGNGQNSMKSLEITLFGDTRQAIKDSKSLSSSLIPPQKSLPRPPARKRIPFKLGLLETEFCENFDYIQALLDIESKWLKLRENRILIDLLDF